MNNYLKNCKRLLMIFLVLLIVATLNTINVFGAKSNIKKNDKSNGSTFYGKPMFNKLENSTLKKIKSPLDTKLLKLIDRQKLNMGETKENIKSQMQSSKQFVPKGSYVNENKTLTPNDVVYVYIKTKTSEGYKNIEPFVYKIVNQDKENKLITAWVEVNKLQLLETCDEVLDVKTVTQPKLNVISEGDHILKSDILRGLSNGTNGDKIKVGVISDGVDHLADSIAKGELTSQTHVLSNVFGGDEGTAMLEIVHDLAPGAELYFHDCGQDKIAFNNAVDALAAEGCKIIVDDVGWISEPYFEDGIIAKHVKQIIDKNGILYVSAAGNYGNSHYQGVYYNDGNNYHDFSSGKSSYKNLYINIKPGDTAQVVLEWNDPFGGSNNDYDLYLADAETGSVLDVSNVVQNGSNDPIEVVSYKNNSNNPINAAVVVENYEGKAASRTLELYISGNNYKNNIIGNDSIFGQAAVPDVIAVGAVKASNPDEIEDYSSQGPVTTLSGEVRPKPDICGVDGVSVSGVGGFENPFYGTSAAAPDVAAVAALLWSKYPQKSSSEIKSLIVNNSVDLNTKGFDYAYGYGRVDALNAFKEEISNGDAFPSVSYQGHVQNIGWQNWVDNGILSGTQGQSLRVEALKMKLENAPAGLKIKYKAHVQNIGWQDWVYDGAMSGTQGQSLRVEALQIMLEGTDAEKYSVEYQAHVQNEGWQNWVKDGQIAGTSGKSQRVEAIRIRIVNKDPSVVYQSHVQNIGWQDWVQDGLMSGTEEKSLRVEGLKIQLQNAPTGLKIKYKAHVQNKGWQDWVYDGVMAGTQGQSLRVEAVQIILEGADADRYSVNYQAHVQNEGWQNWVSDGQIAGTTGKSERIEALRINIVSK